MNGRLFCKSCRTVNPLIYNGDISSKDLNKIVAKNGMITVIGNTEKGIEYIPIENTNIHMDDVCKCSCCDTNLKLKDFVMAIADCDSEYCASTYLYLSVPGNATMDESKHRLMEILDRAQDMYPEFSYLSGFSKEDIRRC